MASIVTFLTTRPNLGIVLVIPGRCRAIKTCRLSRVNGPLVKKWLETAERYALEHNRELEFLKTT